MDRPILNIMITLVALVVLAVMLARRRDPKPAKRS